MNTVKRICSGIYIFSMIILFLMILIVQNLFWFFYLKDIKDLEMYILSYIVLTIAFTFILQLPARILRKKFHKRIFEYLGTNNQKHGTYVINKHEDKVIIKCITKIHYFQVLGFLLFIVFVWLYLKESLFLFYIFNQILGFIFITIYGLAKFNSYTINKIINKIGLENIPTYGRLWSFAEPYTLEIPINEYNDVINSL